MILHGPPGSGKTTLARLVAEASGAAFEEESAVQAGRAEVRAVIERARERLRGPGTKTVFFLDEIHRFNKAQQDALLPAVEEGLVTLIGATTENPYFEVNSALISRTHVYELEALTAVDIRALLDRAVARGECGDPALIDPEALEFLAERSGGDARTALNGARAGVRGGRGRASASPSPTPRTRSSGGRCSTTARRTATTTRSRPGSRPPAARIPTRRSTTWP